MNRLDRRALFTSGAAAALLAATGTSVHGAPQRGGTLRIAIPREDGLFHKLALWASHDALVEIGPDGVLRGELATAWRSDVTARRWEFDLRDDAYFGSGARAAAHDICVSLQRGLGDGATVWEVSARKILVELASSNPHLPYELASEHCVITEGGGAVPALGGANGSGCYHITRAQDGRHFRAERVATHYKDAQSGWVDQVEVAVIPDAAVRAEALRDGFVDVAAFPAAQTLRDRRDLTFHPSVEDMQLAAHHEVGVPRQIGKMAALDDTRIIERWWMV